MDNTDRSSLPEMDNTGRGRGRVNREPGSLPGQARPHGDDDGLSTSEQEEGHLPTHEEVMSEESDSQQASESPDRNRTEPKRKCTFVGVVKFLFFVLLWIGLALVALFVMWACYMAILDILIKPKRVPLMIGVSIIIFLIILLGLSVIYDNVGKKD